MNIKKVENISAIVMIAAFFLPWTNFFGITSNGLSAAKVNPVLWSIPFLAIGVIVSDITKANEKFSESLSYAAGLVPLIFIIMDMPMSKIFFLVSGLGIYLTLLASITMLLGAFKIIKIPG